MTVLCPLCKTNTVELPAWEFSQVEVEVPVCNNHGAAVSVSLRTSALAGLGLNR